jgi:hypothetical protein
LEDLESNLVILSYSEGGTNGLAIKVAKKSLTDEDGDLILFAVLCRTAELLQEL